MKTPTPPRFADWILTRLAPRHIRGDVLGDLHEEYRRQTVTQLSRSKAQLWYWRQVIGTIVLYRSARRSGKPYPTANFEKLHGEEQGRLRKMIGDCLNDARFAMRAFRRSPGFVLAAISVLGIGVGAVTLMFSTLYAVVLRPLPFADPERLVWAWGTSEQRPENSVSALNYFDYRDQASGFESLAEFLVFTPPAVLTGDGEPERVVSNYVSPNLFSTLGITPHVGRGFVYDDERAGAENVVVLGYGLWQRRFGGSRDALGTAVIVDGSPHEVVGVMPPGFDYPGGVDLWFPARTDAFYAQGRANNNFFVVGRLRDGVAIEQTQSQVDVIARQLQEAYPDTNEGWSLTLVPLHERYFANLRPALLILMGTVGFVLLIACANVASLSMARATTRSTEMSVRLALGAARGRIVRQLLTEHFLLAIGGGGLGLFLATLGIGALRTLGPATLPRLDTVGIDGTVLVVTLCVTIVTGFLFGVVPSLKGTSVSLSGALRTGGGKTQSASKARSTLVVAQVALSLMLLISSGLLVRSFVALQRVDPGFQTEGMLLAELQLPGGRFANPEQINQGWDEVIRRVRGLPGVIGVGAIDQAPVRMGGTYNNVFAQGREPANLADYTPAQRRFVTEGYFGSLGMHLVAGRDFEATDRMGASRVTVINEQLALQLWPNENAIGKSVVWSPVPMEVVGVVAGSREFGPAAPIPAMFYVPVRQSAGRTTLRIMIRTTGDPMTVAGMLRDAVWEFDRNIPVSGLQTMQDRIASSLSQPRFRTLIVGLFAVIALVLASLGVYATLAYFVRERTYELAVRMAVGATARNILGLVVRNGMGLVGIGVVLGLAGALGVTRVLRRFLFDIAPTDALTFGGVTSIVIVVALLACLVPARKAMQVDPRQALTAE